MCLHKCDGAKLGILVYVCIFGQQKQMQLLAMILKVEFKDIFA